MFQQKLNKGCVISILGRFMSNSSQLPTQHPKNPFAKEKLPDLPMMEFIKGRNVNYETHLSTRKVKYGDHEFMECPDGFVLSYINVYLRKNKPDAFYGVYFGAKHPLNISGPVNGIPTLENAKQEAVLRAIETFPNIETKKLCICVSCKITIGKLRRLQTYSENGYRNTVNGVVLKNKATFESLNQTLRLRNDIQLRLLYTPADVVCVMKEAFKLAKLAAQ